MDEQGEQPDLVARYDQETKGFTLLDHIRVQVAYKLRHGKPFVVRSADPARIHAVKSLAVHMGATVEEVPCACYERTSVKT
jgi:hypothetical protein